MPTSSSPLEVPLLGNVVCVIKPGTVPDSEAITKDNVVEST